MKNKKTFIDGVMIGFAITAIIYSVLIGILLRKIHETHTNTHAKTHGSISYVLRGSGYGCYWHDARNWNAAQGNPTPKPASH
jgi:hypothetical protein